MAKIGLISVDSHNFPNLALMRISAYHKAKGDAVEWWWSDLEHYDIVYMSKVFSDAYSKDRPEPMNADVVIKGGTGYAINLGSDGKETLDSKRHQELPPEIERCFPDYSIYPQYQFAVSMTTRGCPRQCGFCHVSKKEGCRTVKVANVSDFWNGQKEIKVLDANLTACPDKRDLMRQYKDTGALLDFTQGLDIRLLTDEDMNDLNAMRLKNIHFAWDDPNQELRPYFERYAKETKHKPHGGFGTVYILTNYENCTVEEHLERALKRIYAVTELGYFPYLMVYNKATADKRIKNLQRWCNNIVIFKSCPRFEDYRP